MTLINEAINCRPEWVSRIEESRGELMDGRQKGGSNDDPGAVQGAMHELSRGLVVLLHLVRRMLSAE